MVVWIRVAAEEKREQINRCSLKVGPTRPGHWLTCGSEGRGESRMILKQQGELCSHLFSLFVISNWMFQKPFQKTRSTCLKLNFINNSFHKTCSYF